MIRPRDQNRASTRYEELEDEELVQLFCQSRDERAFQVLHDRYRPRLLGKVTRKLDGNRTAAEDLVQETFSRVYRHLHRYDPEKGRFSTWIWTIAMRITKNRWRDDGRDPQVNFSTLTKNHDEDSRPLQWEDDSHRPDTELAKRETRKVLKEAIGRLRPKREKALRLRMLEGASYQRIADEQAISVGTVKSRLHRARQDLPEALVEGLARRGHATSVRTLPDDLEDALQEAADEAEPPEEVEDLSPEAVAELIEELNEPDEEDEDDPEIVLGETTCRQHSSGVAHVITDRQDGRLYVACGSILPARDEAVFNDPDARLCARCARFMEVDDLPGEDDSSEPEDYGCLTGRAALTEDEARELYRRAAEELPPPKRGRVALYDELADEYEVSRSTVSKLIRGRGVYSRLDLPNLLEQEPVT